MGLPPFGSTSECNSDYLTTPSAAAFNPDPRRYTITRSAQFTAATVVEVVYPDAKNYEGRKVMLYRCSLDEILKQTSLDPHFCDHGEHLAPFARFEPTAVGWATACALARGDDLMGCDVLCANCGKYAFHTACEKCAELAEQKLEIALNALNAQTLPHRKGCDLRLDRVCSCGLWYDNPRAWDAAIALEKIRMCR